MNRLSVFLLICLLVFAQAANDDDCEECGVRADSSIKTATKLLKTVDSLIIGGVKPCDQCMLYGANTMLRNKTVPVCRNKTADGGYINEFHIYFYNLTLICTCNLNANPLVLTNDIVSAFKSFSKINDCSPQERAELADSIKNGGGLNLTGPDMLKLTACKPPTSGIITPKTNYSGTIHATSKDFAVSFNSVVAPGTGRVSIKNISVLTKTFENLKLECIGDNGFKSSCQCLLAANFRTSLVIETVYQILPCGSSEPDARFYDGFIHYLKCEL